MATKKREAKPSVTADVEDVADDSPAVSDSEVARRKLRERWELASVLNFFRVFEPLIKSKLKISAEEIEMALIEPNNLLSQLHIVLLKGIPPVSKTLDRADAWITSLCKKLSEWWPWVAEGDLPLTVAKGEEVSKYREFDPTIRLVILKALCEVRASQGDAVLYINDSIKSGSELSTFRKERICGDDKGTVYWLDGNATIGYRLYKEVDKFESKLKAKDKGKRQPISCHWELLAANLEEFREVVVGFSSSKTKMEVAVSKTIETEVIPALEKLPKKKERELKQRQREGRSLDIFRNSGIARSCRSRPVTYTFDAYDKAIDEAITMQQIKKKKPTNDHGHVKKRSTNIEGSKSAPLESSGSDTKSRDSESTESDTKSERLSGSDDEKSGTEYSDERNVTSSKDGNASNTSDEEHNNVGEENQASFAHRHNGSCWSKRVAGVDNSPAPKRRNQGANRLRQRPTRNSAIETNVSLDSEDECLSENVSDKSRSSESKEDESTPENLSDESRRTESSSSASDSNDDSDN